ncbi:putative membrane protein [Methyloglobulus morosus KoM1]|uniref:Putative membrane protein n=1 Tax=Methyloglobulus morosus KoM1 TaxID=1116472 RepID=V5BHH4_9GAMM|nr:heparan-alpha-glucosaminide N-acetyltransferase domain-containing protein [Methyloglobulus morosus]ESS72760.1 putative membrane protein [Methyloglobulus morosus KoM1]
MLDFRRLESIDLMRGLVMVLMALDHTRDFFSDALFSPTDLSKTSAGLFITRWITHLCAPTFVFLTGASAYLSTIRRNLSKRQLAGYLVTRGLWLVILELTLVRFGWLFNWDYHVLFGQVIWALGWSMVGLSWLIFLPRWVIAGFAIVSIAGHNVLDFLRPDDFGGLTWLWTVRHVPGRIELMPGYSFYVDYPLIPWLGVMVAGYSFGPIFLRSAISRRALLFQFGIGCIGIFLLLRLSNIYGDPEPWQAQQDPLFTVFAVLNCEKYPPSLSYLLVTISIMMLLLSLFEGFNLLLLREPLLIFGRVPLFFYLAHLPLIHGTRLLSHISGGYRLIGCLAVAVMLFPTYQHRNTDLT